MINFWSYKSEYKRLNKKFLKSIDISLKRGNVFFGEELKKFEKNFLKKNRTKYGVAVGSGTEALIIALKSLNIGYGDEVITVSNTAIPTVSAIVNVGAIPRFVDTGQDYLMDYNKIQKLINSKTKAIIPVHLYGQSCNMDRINQIAKKNNLKVIEDCAQAQGAKFKNNFVGNFGDLGCFSFYPTKILGAYGDGGFITTKNVKLLQRIKRLRFYGIETTNSKSKYFNDYYAQENGINSRLDEIQSSILNVKLKYVDQNIIKRRKIAKYYLNQLKQTSLILPNENSQCRHVYHLFTAYHPKGSYIISQLNKKKIQCRKIYPHLIHKMNGYRFMTKRDHKNIQNTEKLNKGIFCLPLYPDLKIKDLKRIVFNLKKILSN